MPPRSLSLFTVSPIPLVEPGDDIADLIVRALEASGERLGAGDIVVVTHKIVSKAEGRYVDLRRVTPSERARELARRTGKDARLVELILSESTEVLRYRQGLIVAVHRLGLVLANAGIDRSNVEPSGGSERVLLLPEDPDGSAGRLRTALEERAKAKIAVVVNDSCGRAWRNGVVGVALGASGLAPLRDYRGKRDLFGKPIETTEEALADEIAGAASLLQGQAGEAAPVVVLRGLGLLASEGRAAELIRAPDLDLFRDRAPGSAP